jgi:hypothetical protein
MMGVQPRRLKALAALALAGTMLGGFPAIAQGLRGTVDEDPISRVGRTAGDQSRNNQITPTGRRAVNAPPLRQNVRRRQAGQAGAPPQNRGIAPDPVLQNLPEGTLPTSVQPRRPSQQNFRSLERPANRAVIAPGPDEIVHQGLPPLLPPRRARSNDPIDPYSPLGLRLGTLVLLPSVDVQTGYDSNPERRSGQKKGSAFARTDVGFTARSDWSTHELTTEVKGGYSRYFSVPDASRPDGNARIGLRLDYTKDTAFDFELRGRLDTQTPGTANLTGRAEGRPLTYQYGGSAGVTQRFNRLALSLRGSVDRSTFDDASLGNGLKLSQQDRNFTQYSLRTRAGYEVTPGIIPFAEVLLDTRQYDQRVDSTGFQRESKGLQARIGSSFEITRTLTGEIAGGYGLRRYEDQRLRDIRGPVVEGALAWSVSPLTTVRLRGTTEFEETTQVGSSGSVTRRISAELSHAFLRNLVFTAGAGFGRADFNGINRKDDTLRANLGIDYSLNRNIVLRASYQHERTTSTAPGNNVSSNVWLFGTKLQF